VYFLVVVENIRSTFGQDIKVRQEWGVKGQFTDNINAPHSVESKLEVNDNYVSLTFIRLPYKTAIRLSHDQTFFSFFFVVFNKEMTVLMGGYTE